MTSWNSSSDLSTEWKFDYAFKLTVNSINNHELSVLFNEQIRKKAFVTTINT